MFQILANSHHDNTINIFSLADIYILIRLNHVIRVRLTVYHVIRVRLIVYHVMRVRLTV